METLNLVLLRILRLYLIGLRFIKLPVEFVILLTLKIEGLIHCLRFFGYASRVAHVGLSIVEIRFDYAFVSLRT